MLQEVEVSWEADVCSATLNEACVESLPLSGVLKLMRDHRSIDSLDGPGRHQKRVKVSQDQRVTWRNLLRSLQELQGGCRRKHIVNNRVTFLTPETSEQFAKTKLS